MSNQLPSFNLNDINNEAHIYRMIEIDQKEREPAETSEEKMIEKIKTELLLKGPLIYKVEDDHGCIELLLVGFDDDKQEVYLQTNTNPSENVVFKYSELSLLGLE